MKDLDARNADQKIVEENKAKGRFIAIGAVRFMGAVFMAVGMAIIANGFMDLPIEFGYIMFALGVFEFIAIPVIMSRMWKSQSEE